LKEVVYVAVHRKGETDPLGSASILLTPGSATRKGVQATFRNKKLQKVNRQPSFLVFSTKNYKLFSAQQILLLGA
jgi:hypothetical protein